MMTNFSLSGTGSMVAAVATASGRQPVVLGKPSKFMFEIVQKRHPGILPERTLMIGDRYLFFSAIFSCESTSSISYNLALCVCEMDSCEIPCHMHLNVCPYTLG